MRTNDSWFTPALAELTLTLADRVRATTGLQMRQPIRVADVIGVSTDGRSCLVQLIIPGRPKVIAKMRPRRGTSAGYGVFVFPASDDPDDLVAVPAAIVLYQGAN